MSSIFRKSMETCSTHWATTINVKKVIRLGQKHHFLHGFPKKLKKCFRLCDLHFWPKGISDIPFWKAMTFPLRLPQRDVMDG